MSSLKAEMAAEVKAEPTEGSKAGPSSVPLGLEELIRGILSENKEGVTDEELRQKTPAFSAAQRQEAVNSLLGQQLLSLSQMGKMLVYKPADPSSAAALRGASPEEAIVYQLVQDASAKGLWVKDIRESSGLAQNHLNKVLKVLETRKLIKSVRAVGAVRRKMYILYELEPSEQLSGGALFSDQEFDHEFADLLRTQMGKFLVARAALARQKFPGQPLAARRASFADTASVHAHIQQLDISKIRLPLDDVRKVLDSLVFEGRAERAPTGAQDGGFKFRALAQREDEGGLARLPCSFCPLRHDCRPQGRVSPANCQYFTDWLL